MTKTMGGVLVGAAAPLLFYPPLFSVERLPMRGMGAEGVEVEEYAAARKSRPIFQRGTIATERPSDHLKYLVAGRKLSDPATETC